MIPSFLDGEKYRQQIKSRKFHVIAKPIFIKGWNKALKKFWQEVNTPHPTFSTDTLELISQTLERIAISEEILNDAIQEASSGDTLAADARNPFGYVK